MFRNNGGAVVHVDVNQRSAEWHAHRAGRLTSSIFAAAAGQSRWKSRKALFKELTGRSPPFTGNMRTRWGNTWEPWAIRNYEAITGRGVTPQGFVLYPKWPWLGASPDGLVGERGMAEIKCPWSRQPYDSVPDYYMPQLQGQMAIAEREWNDFVSFGVDTEGDEVVGHVRIWRVHFSESYWAQLEPELRTFVEYWVTDQEPPRYGRGKVPKLPECVIEPTHDQKAVVLPDLLEFYEAAHGMGEDEHG